MKSFSNLFQIDFWIVLFLTPACCWQSFLLKRPEYQGCLRSSFRWLCGNFGKERSCRNSRTCWPSNTGWANVAVKITTSSKVFERCWSTATTSRSGNLTESREWPRRRWPGTSPSWSRIGNGSRWSMFEKEALDSSTFQASAAKIFSGVHESAIFPLMTRVHFEKKTIVNRKGSKSRKISYSLKSCQHCCI